MLKYAADNRFPNPTFFIDDGFSGVTFDRCDNEFTPFQNLFNDFNARDTSRKNRTVMKAKSNSGEHLCTNPPYGYMKDPADKVLTVKAYYAKWKTHVGKRAVQLVMNDF